jgi:trehalose monomycolate/heme transporter
MSSTATAAAPKVSTDHSLFARWGRFTYRRRWVLLVASLLFMVVGGVWGTSVIADLSQGGFNDPGASSTTAAKVLSKDFARANADAIIVYSAPAGSTLTVDSPVFEQAVAAVAAQLPAKDVLGFTTYWNAGRNPAFVTRDHKATYAILRLSGADESARATSYGDIEKLLVAKGLVTQRGGDAAIQHTMTTTIQKDIARAETMSFIALGILLVIVFGSLVASSLPLAIGGISILGAFTALRLLTYVTDISVFAINIVTMLGLGLAIDYGLFVVSRFREQLAAGDDVETAVVHTVATAGRTVAFSGVTVALSLGALLLFPQGFLRSMGMGGIAAVVIAMVAALTTLPALLAVLGRRVDAGRMPWYRLDKSTANENGAWARLATFVMRRPIIVVASTLALLLVLGAPFFKVSFGGIDARALPAANEARVATETATKLFPAVAATPINVVLTNAGGVTPSSLQSYAESLGSLPNAVSATVVAPASAATNNTAFITVNYSGNSIDPKTRALVTDIRAAQAPAGAGVLVGGRSAELTDLLKSLQSHLPWAALYLAIATFLLLFLAFGSLVLPLKAIVMNLLSLSATFGVLVWGFQQGHLAGPLHFTSTGTLEATQPVLILALAFGLSMDYEVFLLSRMREEWDASNDNRRAVRLGLQRTGRIITSAALLFVVVIIAFSTSGITFIKMIGVGLAVAVVVDATIVRALLVPATMALLGNWNWWLPAPLQRFWDRFGVREAGAALPHESAAPVDVATGANTPSESEHVTIEA